MWFSRAVRCLMLVLCTCLLIWKTHDCIAQYLQFQLASSVLPEQNAKDPRLASILFCRPGSEMLDRSILATYDLKQEDIGTMKPLRVLASGGKNYHDVYHRSLSSPDALVTRANIEIQGEDHNPDFDLASAPRDMVEHVYKHVYKFGNCTVFHIIRGNRSTNNLKSITFVGQRAGAGYVSVDVFENQQHFMTAEHFHWNYYESLTMKVAAHVEDKSELKGVLDECEESSFHKGYDEDACLQACLVKRFVERAGCLHPSMAYSPSIAKEHPEAKFCTLKDKLYTSDLADIFPVHAWSTAQALGDNHVEPGETLIDQIKQRFHDQTKDFRCGCPRPCWRKRFNLNFWEHSHNPPDTDGHWLKLRFEHDIVVAKYSLSYTLTSLFAEVGGYIGLFLGFSLFSAYDLYLATAAYFKKKREPVSPTSE